MKVQTYIYKLLCSVNNFNNESAAYQDEEDVILLKLAHNFLPQLNTSHCNQEVKKKSPTFATWPWPFCFPLNNFRVRLLWYCFFFIVAAGTVPTNADSGPAVWQFTQWDICRRPPWCLSIGHQDPPNLHCKRGKTSKLLLKFEGLEDWISLSLSLSLSLSPCSTMWLHLWSWSTSWSVQVCLTQTFTSFSAAWPEHWVKL